MANIFNALGYAFGYILWLFFDLFNNYPLAIICFTLVVKGAMIPFELKSRRASFKMARLNKKQAEIQKKYKNNKEKMNEELAKLYQQEGNPMGGCLPQLIPMLSFMGIYFAIVSPLTNMFHISFDKVNSALAAIGHNGGYYGQLEIIKRFPTDANLLSIFNQTEANAIMDFNKGFNFFGLDLFPVPAHSPTFSSAWLWPVLCMITMIASTLVMQKTNTVSTSEAPGCMKFMPYLFSIPFLFVVINAPAGVGFYYAFSNVLSIVQNFLITKYYNPHIVTAKQEAARIALRDIQESNVSKISKN